MVKFSVPTLLLLCFLAALASTQAQEEPPFAKFCDEQQSSCSETCGDKVKEFVCNKVTGITTSPCVCEDGKTTKPTVDPPPAPPATEDTSETDDSGDASDTPATPSSDVPNEASTPTEEAAASTTPAAPSSAPRTAGSVLALGFVAAAMFF
ncbi:hypothetical protein Ndes2526B_g09605 [Nannochloris sp. 'desiccata']|nr:hypothetical protein KSW81_000623 [Chlorella desiccata (nom. nud.)]KAH7615650.1 hypothetical protein NADE_007447 [Chlorella desiccata (nom. nud.)]KAH7615760.1 hypothetical protein NADE_007550 [Chlorella desiccata (nom. nud.)]KAH7620732.1 hypothetical protein NADE_003345 [Chlorella desiccata (nom. nud.)]